MNDLKTLPGMLNHQRTVYSALFVVLSLYFTFIASSGAHFLINPDAGVQLSLGMLILDGRHPIIDYATAVYGPAIYYVSALLQKIFGQRLVGEVLTSIVAFTTSYVLFFYLLRRLKVRRTITLATTVLAVLLAPRFYKYYVVLPPLFFALVTLYKVEHSDNKYSSPLLGLAAFVCGAFRIDIGAYAVITGLLLLTLIHRASLKHTVIEAGKFLGTGVILFLPYLIWISFKANILDIATEFFYVSSNITSGLALPFPRILTGAPFFSQQWSFSLLFWFFFFFPFIVLIVTIIQSIRNRLNESLIILISLSTFTILLLLQATHRTDYPHLLQALPINLLLFGIVISKFTDKRRNIWQVNLSSGVVFGLLLIMAWPLSHASRTTVSIDSLSKNISEWTRPAKKLVARYARGGRKSRIWQAEAMHFIGENSSLSDKILVMPFMPQFYFFSGRDFAGKIQSLHPGSFRDRRDQKRFLKGVQNARFIVDWPAFSFDRREARNLRSYARHSMQKIYRTRAIVQQFGPALILQDANNIERTKNDYLSTFIPIPTNELRISPYSLTTIRVNSLAVRSGSTFDLPVGSALWLTNTKYGALPSISCVVIDNGALQYRASYQPTISTARARYKIPAITGTGGVAPGKYRVFVAEDCDKNNVNLFDTGVALNVPSIKE